MNSHAVWKVRGSKSAALWINLVVSTGVDDRFLVHFGPDGPVCPAFAWSTGFENTDDLASAIESAVFDALRVKVQFVETLAFIGLNLFALVTGPVTTPATEILTVAEMVDRGVQPETAQIFQAAADRVFVRRFATGLGPRIQNALDRAVVCLERSFAVADGRAGWSEDFNAKRVGVLSSAAGLLTLVHADVRNRLVRPATTSLEQAQNNDGGWQVRHSLVGQPNDVSITESTCFALWALVEVGGSAEDLAVARGLGWLLNNRQPTGGWRTSERDNVTRVIPTAFAIRILSRLGAGDEILRDSIDWLLDARTKDGAWGYVLGVGRAQGESAVAPTAHGIVSLLAAGIAQDDEAVVRGCQYLKDRFQLSEDQAPWPSAVSTTNVDTDSKLAFGHFATPWALIALIRAGHDLRDPMVQRGLHRLLELQEPDGVWLDPAFANERHLWAVHDATYALRTVLSLSAANLTSMALDGDADQANAVRESVILRLASDRVGHSRRLRRR